MSLIEICKDFGIPVLSYPPEQWERSRPSGVLPLTPGAATILEGKPYILCDESRSREEVRYTIAHELGHILLGHLSFRAKSGDYAPYMETEANIFAAVLLASDLYHRERTAGWMAKDEPGGAE